MSKHTPGPWQVVPAGQAEHRWVVGDVEGGSIASCEPMGPWMTMPEADANCRLIAAAPDHALICWAMCIGGGRWEAWGDGRGEFCINGLRHVTELDEFGCPKVTGGIRDAITKARGAA